jgi:GTA TIM-barrel-like domain/Putative phage tail protein
MTTLVFQAVGTAVGTMLGGPVGAAIGSAIGASVGGMVDRSLFAPTRHISGPRPRGLEGLASSEGSPVPRLYGRARLGGQIIWATRFIATTAKRRGKGGGGVGGGTKETSYFANFAVALCEGEITRVRRIWADGKLIDQKNLTLRVYRGENDQLPDALIVAKEGEENAPAYRGTAYVVFERFPLSAYGNRIPQLTFEVIKPANGLSSRIRAVNLIPGAGEFVYASTPTSRSAGFGQSASENRHVLHAGSDFEASLDDLEAFAPNCTRVQLVVTWFGDDLRASHCTIAPRVDAAAKNTAPLSWSVAGLSRSSARIVTEADGAPAYGGTPSDSSIISAIQSLKARGYEVVLYPFVMMDIPTSNTLPDPYGGASQKAYPWRGEITASIAPNRSGTLDGTAAITAEVNAFFGSEDPSASEWSYRRMILHYADLAVTAGGVDGFIIGSEFVGLTRLRSASGVYPAVANLTALAADVRTQLGAGTKLTYAADWTEYGAHVLGSGSEVRFPLDPLWASPHIDAVGIDWYPPLTDWRERSPNPDGALASSPHDLNYLASRVAGGEAYDWYYASNENRKAALRTTITDGAYNKPWIYRAKDLKNWWAESHIERVGGIEQPGPTAWSPASKPIWLTEIGCPAVHAGTNSPNLFPDQKASATLPPFSHGGRDDALLLRANEAIIAHFDSAHAAHEPANNPISSTYGGPMVDPASIAVWAYDARPFPAFPLMSEVWADGPNYETGHWLNGRLELATLQTIVEDIAGQHAGLTVNAGALTHALEGFVLDRPMSARAALEDLAMLYAFRLIERDGMLHALPRAHQPPIDLTADMIVENEETALLTTVHGDAMENPRAMVLTMADAEADYSRASVAATISEGEAGQGERTMETPLILRRSEAHRLAAQALRLARSSRESLLIELAPSHVHIEAGDLLRFDPETGPAVFEIERIVEGASRRVEARSLDVSALKTRAPFHAAARHAPPKLAGKPAALFMALKGDPEGVLLRLAVHADPWVGPLAVYAASRGFEEPHAVLERPASVGVLMEPLEAGPLWRWDRANTIMVKLYGGELSSLPLERVLTGGNLAAIQSMSGAWEVVQFSQAELIAPQTWRLSLLLRGQHGSEEEARLGAEIGAHFVLLDSAVVPLVSNREDVERPEQWWIGPASDDPAEATFEVVEITPQATALLPLSPVHPMVRRKAEGLQIQWIRRTRLSGDNWATTDVPLGEEGESYTLEILAGPSVVRSIICSTPDFLYLNALELSDFSVPQAALTLRIMQNSLAYGPGHPWQGTLPVL